MSKSPAPSDPLKPNSYPPGSVWLQTLGEMHRGFCHSRGVKIPPKDDLEYHFGFPERGKNKRDSLPLLGEVHHRSRSSNDKFCIIVSLEANDDSQIIAIVLRLLIDASVELGLDRAKRISERLNRVGMIGKPRHAIPDKEDVELTEHIALVKKEVGDRPSMTLVIPEPAKKDTTRSLKVTCVGKLKGGLVCDHLSRSTNDKANRCGCGIHGRNTIRVTLMDGRVVDLGSFPPPPEAETD